jgi:hypothetical protein
VWEKELTLEILLNYSEKFLKQVTTKETAMGHPAEI